MNSIQKDEDAEPANRRAAPQSRYRSRRLHILGLDSDDCVRAFFGGNAGVAIVVLALIMFFLFRESAGFFGQNAAEMRLYRQSGLEYADKMRVEVDEFFSLSKYLTGIESEELTILIKRDGIPFKEAKARTAALHRFTGELRDSVAPFKTFVDTQVKEAMSIRNDYRLNPAGTNLAARREKLLVGRAEFLRLSDELRRHAASVAANLPAEDPRFHTRFEKFRDMAENFVVASHRTDRALESWDPEKPVYLISRLGAFLFGASWVTNSYYQDWYGVLPLLYGSLIVSLIALIIAVPFGIAGAIYVNQFASHWEQRLIKPYIEFISAIPSVVIGFFGVVVWGQFVREASQWEALSWIPGFPLAERLNAFTAGCLLAIMAIPTIFTLAEDALNNVPKAFTEASYAVGATRLQTTSRIIVPTAMSGMISAVLLGFGRVIGETMVVLLCAGNRIEMPPLSDGLAAFFKPVHTMTGLVAQEMGEVVQGSTHYRALFMVGTLLFFISLLINYVAQKILRRYSISEK